MKAIAITVGLVAALGAHLCSAQQCPSDTDIRNLEVSASSITLKRDERENLQQQIRLARACRMGPDAMRSERNAQDAQEERKAMRRDLSRCQVQSNGNIWCPNN